MKGKRRSIFIALLCFICIFSNISEVSAKKSVWTAQEMKKDCGHAVGTEDSYEGWQCLTVNKSTAVGQATIHTSKNSSYSKNGFGLYNNFYVVAMRDTFGDAGSFIRITYKDKKVLYVVLGDTKSGSDEGANDWGHEEGRCMVEYVVNGGKTKGNSWKGNWNTHAENSSVPNEEGIKAWYKPNVDGDSSKDNRSLKDNKDDVLKGINTSKNPVAKVEYLGNAIKTPNKKVEDFGGTQTAEGASGGSSTTSTANLGGNLKSSDFYITGSAEMYSVLKSTESADNLVNYSAYQDAKVSDIETVLKGGVLSYSTRSGISHMPSADANKAAKENKSESDKYCSSGGNTSDMKVYVVLSGEQEIKKNNGKGVWNNYKKIIENSVSDGKHGAIICGIPFKPDKKGKKGAINKQIEIFNKEAQAYANKTELVNYVDVNDIADIKNKSLKGKTGDWDSKTNAYKSSSKISSEIRKKIDSAITSYISTDKEAHKNAENKKQENSNKQVKVNGRVYDETHFLTANQGLIDSPLTMPRADMMTVNEQTQVAKWSENIDNNKTTAVSWLRTLIAFLGIMITIYSLLIYLAYWLDRVNNIIPVWLLPILTFKHLVVSPDETSSFNPEVEGEKAVIHKDVIKIVIIGCTLGVLLMTGQMYKIIYFVWDKVQSILGGL